MASVKSLLKYSLYRIFRVSYPEGSVEYAHIGVKAYIDEGIYVQYFKAVSLYRHRILHRLPYLYCWMFSGPGPIPGLFSRVTPSI